MRFFRIHYQLNHIHGIDNNLVAVLYARFLQKFHRYHNLQVFYGDIKSIDISGYDYIYLFLLPGHIDELQPWLIQNMKSDAIVISNTFSFSNRKPSQEFRGKES